MKVVSQILDASVGQIPIVVSPGKLFLHESSRDEGLHRFDDMQIPNLGESRMFGCIEVSLCNHHTFLEKVLIDCMSVFLGHQHDDPLVVVVGLSCRESNKCG